MKKIVAIIVMVLTVTNIYSQKKVVYGKVNFNEHPVKNVIIEAKKSKASVISDESGRFVIACEKNDVLLFKTKSFEQLRKKVNNNDSMIVNLKLKKAMINEQGVLLYNYPTVEENRVDLYSAQNENNSFTIHSNIFDLIKTKFPSVRVLTNGKFGINNGGRIIIRGTSSIAMTTPAIYVVNGTIVDDISYIQPDNVKSINILSSAEGVIRYGGDAKNGVVVIKTKTDL